MNNLQTYLELIRKQKKDVKMQGTKSCFVLNNDRLFLLMNSKFITAQELKCNYGYGNIVSISNKYDADRSKITQEFGFQEYTINSGNIFQNIKIIIEAVIWIAKRNVDILPDSRYKGILIGDLIYDSVIMKKKNTYTLKTLWCKEVIKETMKVILIIHELQALFKKYRPDFLITGDLVYHDAVYVRFFNSHKVTSLVLTTGRPSHIFNKKISDYHLNYDQIYASCIRAHLEHLPDNWEKEVDERLKMLFEGKGDWNAARAYKDKELPEREEALKEIGINNNKKNIVIMAHCFSDAPHRTLPMIHRDYYDWLIKTLELTAENDKVNWILKAHPSRAHYGEQGVVEGLFERYKNAQLYWMPEKFSTRVIERIADAIITVNGSAGMELSCLGIPCINAGNPYYAEFGYTHVPQSTKQYNDLLKNIEKLELLTEKQIIKAKQVLWAFYKIILNDQDEFAMEGFQIHQSFIGHGNVNVSNSEFIEKLNNLIKSGKYDQIYDITFINEYMKNETKK